MKFSHLVKPVIVAAAVVLLLLGGWAYLRPLPPATPSRQNLTAQSPSAAASLSWPAYGQSQLSSADYGFSETSGQQKQVPTASVAKIITALAVLQKQPLKSDQTGPILSLDSTDVSFYETQYQQGGSVVKVASGEQISLYQALQAMLLPSGNNMADSLARWAFGSAAAYNTYANKMVKVMGANNTVVADPSGFSPDTISTASDLVLLGQKAMANPVLAEIVGQQTASIPVAGTIKNVNWLLGDDGVVGIKTGSTDQAGGNYLFAAKRTIAGKETQVVGTVMGAPNRNQAIVDSRTLIRSIDRNFTSRQLLADRQTVATYHTAWGASANAVVSGGASLITWKSLGPKYSLDLRNISGGLKAGAKVGEVTVKIGNQTLRRTVVVKDDVPAPPFYWRFFR